MARLPLDPPLLRLTLNDRVLSFGGTETLDPQRYVRYGDSVYLCSDRCYCLLPGNPEPFTASPSKDRARCLNCPKSKPPARGSRPI